METKVQRLWTTLLLMALSGCGSKQGAELASYPYVPDTNAIPELVLNWESPVRRGENVYALAGGIVVSLAEGVSIRYGRNLVIHYAHVDRPVVREGQIVGAGQAIARTPSEGLWGIEVNVRENDVVFKDSLMEYLDPTSKGRLGEIEGLSGPSRQKVSISDDKHYIW